MAATTLSDPNQVQEAVSRLLSEAKEQDFVERRGEPRHPFFQPATLTYRYRPEEPVAVFTRELSQSGIGLLSPAALERGEVAVTLQSRSGPVVFRVYILWCKPCGPWHLSGGQFLFTQG